MTEQELAEYDALANAATPGPWFLHGKRADYEDDFVWAPRDQSADSPYHPLAQQLAEGYGIESVCHVAASENWDADRAFIAAARSAVPALVAEVRRLRGLS